MSLKLKIKGGALNIDNGLEERIENYNIAVNIFR
jgi:hypothetical protein